MDYLAQIYLVIAFGLGVFVQKYLNKKGENLARKEDIAEITDKVEQVKSAYTERLEQTKLTPGWKRLTGQSLSASKEIHWANL